ncbi:phasin family protein [Caldimonas tepidiphila]|uniref:phasin family protein n=1 Tax=Caldimonas tepidiphila TaxID=2315841 RepID=UPI00130082F3|nr:phasin family protein [Caldimonas tepidiphila]
MAYAPERLVNAQRALFETSQNLGLKSIEGAARLFELNVQTMSSMLGSGGDRMAGMAGGDGASAMQAGTSLMQADGKALASYTRQVMEIVSSTNGEIARLIQQQAASLQSLASEMMNATMNAAPGTNDALQSMMRAPFGAMQRGFEQANGAATRAGNSVAQAADTTTQAAAQATAQTADAAMRSGRRMQTND